jgi:uncharacterized repeat protein (TIGR01451 family)
MKKFRKIGIALLAGAFMLTGFASNAMALTDACVTISNQASLTYSVGGVPETTPVLSDGDNGTAGIQTTDFLVATKVDLTVATFNSPATATGTDNVLTFSITNTGNDQQRYGLALYNAATGYDLGGGLADNFDMTDTNIRVYLDNDGIYGNGGLTTITNSATLGGTNLGYTGPVDGNNGIVYVHVFADVPAGKASGDIAAYALKAITHQISTENGSDGSGGATPGGETDETANTANFCSSAIVLADGQATGTGTGGAGPGGVTDGAKDGDSFAVGYYLVDTAAISVTKSYKVLEDPINGAFPNAKPIPGARIEYTMTITNGSATTAATALTLIDQIPSNTDFVVDSLSVPDGTPDYSNTVGTPTPGYSPVGSTGDPDPAVTYILATIPTLAASDNTTVVFEVLIE